MSSVSIDIPFLDEVLESVDAGRGSENDRFRTSYTSASLKRLLAELRHAVIGKRQAFFASRIARM
jgi:hypothetical protein